MARYLIVGGTGLVGRAMVKRLLERGDHVAIGTRSPYREPLSDVRVVRLPLSPDEWEKAAAQAPFAGVVNLAGRSIFSGRWTRETKQAILSSRVATTQLLVNWLQNSKTRPSVLVNGSAVGYYGPSAGAEISEDSEPEQRDFLAGVAAAWENAADTAQASGVRVVKARLGVVLAKDGGALPRLLLPYRMRVGGTIGSGRQWVSWVHIDDAARLLVAALDQPDVAGPLNVTAPEPVTMRDLGTAIARELGTHSLFSVPKFAIRAVLGEAGDLILYGQKVLPKKALASGFDFQYSTIQDALRQLLN